MVFFEPDNLLDGADIFHKEVDKWTIVGYWFASGLWRVIPDQFESCLPVKNFFPDFYLALREAKLQ